MILILVAPVLWQQAPGLYQIPGFMREGDLMDLELRGKGAIVTGASKGIWRQLAWHLPMKGPSAYRICRESHSSARQAGATHGQGEKIDGRGDGGRT